MGEASELLLEDPVLRSVARTAGGDEVWVTGGWIRDRLLDLVPRELDLAVPGDASRARSLAERLSDTVHATPHLLGKPPHSVWRLDGTRLKVEIWPRGSLSVVEDCKRRDFTCNALQWRLPAGPLQDPTGGYVDLERRLLRAVSRENLEDDPVRLLRAPRLLAQLPRFRLDASTGGWIRELAGHLTRAPAERLGQELLRTAAAPYPARGFQLLEALGLLDALSGPGRNLPRPPFSIMAAATHWLADPRCVLPRWGVTATELQAAKLGALLAGWAPARFALDSFAWSRDLRLGALQAAAGLHRALVAVDGQPGRRREVIFRSGTSFPIVFSLACATALATGRRIRQWRRWWLQWRRSGSALVHSVPLLRGDEVASLFARDPGPWLGTLLEELRMAQVRGEVRTAAGARRWLRRFTPASGIDIMSRAK